MKILLKNKLFWLLLLIFLIFIVLLAPFIPIGTYKSYFSLNSGYILKVNNYFYTFGKCKLIDTELSEAIKENNISTEKANKFITISKTEIYLLGKKYYKLKTANAYYKDVHYFFYADGKPKDISREELIEFRKRLIEKYGKYTVTPSFPLLCNNPLDDKTSERNPGRVK